MKKQLLSTLVLFTAASMTVPAVARFTMSLGVQAAHLDIESTTDRWLSIPKESISNALNDSEDNQATDIGGELAIGHQYDINNTVDIAFEIFGQLAATHVRTPVYSNYTDEITTESGAPVQDATASFNWITGLRLRPGYDITPSTRLFIDGGVVLGGFELEYTDPVANFWNSIPGLELDKTETASLWGWRYGAGIEHQVSDNFVIGLDFILTEFESFESDNLEDLAEFVNAEAANGGSTGNIVAQNSYTPTLTTMGLNFKYLFGSASAKRQAPQKFYPMRDK